MSRRSLTLATFVVVAGMILGRLSGMVRELSMAGMLGVTPDADLAIFAISIPDLLTALLIGGAVGAVLVPEFHRLTTEDSPEAANQLVCQSLLGIGLASLLISLLLALGGRYLVMLLAPGFAGAQLDAAAALLRTVLIAFPCCTLAAVTAAALQARGRVVVVSLGTLLLNAVLIAAIVVLLAPGHVGILGWAVVAATSVRLVSQLAACWHAGLLAGWHGALRMKLLDRRLVIRYTLALSAIGLTVFAPLIGRAFASHVDGGIARFNYAFKLVELPRGLLAVALTMVLFPRISQLFASRRAEQAGRLVGDATRLVIVLSVPLAIGLSAGAQPIVSLLFERGEIGSDQVERIASLVRIAFAALPALALVVLAMSVYHAQNNTRFPFLVSLVMTAAHLALSKALWAAWGEAGLMVALAAVAWLHWLVLAIGLRRSYGISMLGTSPA